jgi:GcrA cell cycle regulator
MDGSQPLDLSNAAAWMWTPEREALARRLYLEEGFTASETARALGDGVSRGAVIGKIKRLGFSKRRPSEPRAQAAPRRCDWATTVRWQKLRTRSWPPQPLPPLREAPPQGPPAILAELGEACCRWPIDDPGPARMHMVLFCAAPTAGVYCAAHLALARLSPAIAAKAQSDDAERAA